MMYDMSAGRVLGRQGEKMSDLAFGVTRNSDDGLTFGNDVS
jgi:hypothetical protein